MSRPPPAKCHPRQGKWLKKDKEFIEVLQEYELKNTFGTKGAKRNDAWREISTRLMMRETYCKRKWAGMKYNYLIIKKMIRMGRVTEDMVRSHVQTTKYLDGSLDFLERSMFEISDSEIPLAAHRFFESAFGSYDELSVDAEKLIRVQDNSAIVIKDYKQDTRIEPTSILPNIENYDSDSDNRNTQEAIVSSGYNQGVSEVYHIDDDSSDVEFVDLDDLPNVQKKNEDPIGNAVTRSTGDRLRKILMSTKNETSIPSETDSEDGHLYRFLVKYQNTTMEKEENCDLKEYMKDLADVACNRLTPGTGKRKYFLSQVDLIVSEILEPSGN